MWKSAEEVSFEWSHHRTSFTDSKVKSPLVNVSITEQMGVKGLSTSHTVGQFVWGLNLLLVFIWLFDMLSVEPNDIAPVAVSHIAGQPINSTEQEVIGLLLAQQQVFTSSGKLEPSSVYVNQSTNPSSVAMVTDDVLQPHGTESKTIVMVSFAAIKLE